MWNGSKENYEWCIFVFGICLLDVLWNKQTPEFNQPCNEGPQSQMDHVPKSWGNAVKVPSATCSVCFVWDMWNETDGCREEEVSHSEFLWAWTGAESRLRPLGGDKTRCNCPSNVCSSCVLLSPSPRHILVVERGVTINIIRHSLKNVGCVRGQCHRLPSSHLKWQ